MVEIKAKDIPQAAVAAAVKTPVADPFALLKGIFRDDRNRLNIKLFNVLLFACVAGLTVRFWMIMDSSVKKMKAIDFRITADPGGEIREKTVLKKVDYYLDKVKKRDIFKMGMAARPENVVETGPSSKAVEATQNFRLVGISWSNDPDAMVEDIKAMKTFFVKRGQLIGGEVKVESIAKDKIVLRFGQELVELR